MHLAAVSLATELPLSACVHRDGVKYLIVLTQSAASLQCMLNLKQSPRFISVSVLTSLLESDMRSAVQAGLKSYVTPWGVLPMNAV